MRLFFNPLFKISPQESIAQVSEGSWRNELEVASGKYHHAAAWFAILLDPLFAVTDYINIHENWFHIFILRVSVSLITLANLWVCRKLSLPSSYIAGVPLLLISLQNAYTYNFLDNDNTHLVGHNFNYMALIIGAAMFVLWHWLYSAIVIVISVFTTAYFIYNNPYLSLNEFFPNGGLLLCVVTIFMLVLIQTRYNLTVKEIKTRIALQISNEEVQLQNEELQAQEEIIRGINENLENLIHVRTLELKKKNQALEEYAFINAHKLRAPVASILGLINLIKKGNLDEDTRNMVSHLQLSADKLDAVVNSITKAIEKGDDYKDTSDQNQSLL
ncbi:hypothetical protein [Chryseosolibacter indicus]|uniref:histidine kinase n=1 Tax=Chryseosolibacter indicus TaxID=2782351 RepID=A0ABS5VW19_9BACT|nr:hypothetical protein [Chryseosolibacter indicus]MBT1705020.1 hypothetical protein [Chryseosolibacter indicus]